MSLKDAEGENTALPAVVCDWIPVQDPPAHDASEITAGGTRANPSSSGYNLVTAP